MGTIFCAHIFFAQFFTTNSHKFVVKTLTKPIKYVIIYMLSCVNFWVEVSQPNLTMDIGGKYGKR